MSDHAELLLEMDLIERLPTQERLKQAKRRRALQLKRWSDSEKESTTNVNSQHRVSFQNNRNHIYVNKRIKFQDHIMLLDAVSRKDYDEAKRLLESGVDPNLANEDGLTSIHQCCIDDNPEILKLLIDYGANVNVCDNDLWTPLHAAATCANKDICKILIQNNAELLAVNTDGNMPYDICDDEICLEYIESEMANNGVTQQAIDIKRAEIEIKMLDEVKYIPIKDLDKKLVEQNGATLMHIACANGYSAVLEYLLEHKASLSLKDDDGWTPLHVATFWGHQKSIELLIEWGADIYSKTNNDETVLDLSDDIDVREFILQKKKEIENNDKASKPKAIKRTSTGVSRSSSVRRSSFRDKEKCRKLDTSFKQVLIETAKQPVDDLENEEFVDKSFDQIFLSNSKTDDLSGFTNSLNSIETNNNSSSITSTTSNKNEIKLQNSVNSESPLKQQQIDSNHNHVLQINNNKNNNSHKENFYVNQNQPAINLNNSDFENKTVFALKSVVSNNSYLPTVGNNTARVFSNGNNNTTTTITSPKIENKTNLKEESNNNKITNQYIRQSQLQPQSDQLPSVAIIDVKINPTKRNEKQQNTKTTNNYFKTTFEDSNKTYPIIDTEGVKYKFISHETIGGKSDISSQTSSKFKCSNCSIM